MDDTQDQRERRRVQNRESQRRWRQRNKIVRARLAHQSDIHTSRKRSFGEISGNEPANSWPTLECKSCIPQSGANHDISNVQSLTNKSNQPAFPVPVWNRITQNRGQFSSPLMNAQYPVVTSRNTSYSAGMFPTSPLAFAGNCADQSQPPVGRSWTPLPDSHFSTPGAAIIPNALCDMRMPYLFETFNIGSSDTQSILSQECRDDFSSCTNSPSIPLPLSMERLNLMQNHGKEINYPPSLAMVGTHENLFFDRACIPDNCEANETDAGRMLDDMQDIFQYGIQNGMWANDVGVMNWLNSTREQLITSHVNGP